MKVFAKVSVLLVMMTCTAVSGRADIVTVDENGNGFYTPTGGQTQRLQVVTSPLGGSFLAYQLPFLVTQGNVSIFNPSEAPCTNAVPFQSGACDIISFGSASFLGNTNTLTFVSDGSDGTDSRADTDISSFAGAAGTFQELIETGPEGNNMASVTYAQGTPNAGAPANGGTVTSVTYTFISDGTATPPVPEPTSLMLLGTGLIGVSTFIRR